MKKNNFYVIFLLIILVLISGFTLIVQMGNIFDFSNLFSVTDDVTYSSYIDDNCNVSEIVSFEGKSNVIKFTDESTKGTAKIVYPVDDLITGTIKFSIYMSDNNKRCFNVGIKSLSKYMTKIRVYNWNKIQYLDEDSNDDIWRTLERYNKENWYEIQITFDARNNRYNLNVDGETEVENELFYDMDLGSIDSIVFETVKTTKDYSVYLSIESIA